MLIVALTMVVLLYWRLPIAGAILRVSLDWAGLPDVRVTVTDVTLSRLRLAEIRLGGEVEAASADITFDLIGPLGPTITRLSLGPTRLDLTDPAGALRRRFDEPRTAGSVITIRRILDLTAAMPLIAVEGFELRYPADGHVLSFSGSVATQRTDAHDYRVRYALQMNSDLGNGTKALSIKGTALIGRTLSSIDARLAIPDEVASGTLVLRADLTKTDARISGTARIDVDDVGRLSKLVTAFEGAVGRLSLSARSLTTLNIALGAPLDRTGLESVLRRAGTDGLAIDASVKGGHHPAGMDAVDATLSVVARNPDMTADGLRVDGKIELRASRLHATGIDLEDMTLLVPVRMKRRDDIIVITLPEPVRARVAEVKAGFAGISVSPVTLSLRGARTHAVRFDIAAGQADLQLTLDAGAATVRSSEGSVRRVDIAPFTLQLAGTANQNDEMRLHLRARRLSATERDNAFIIEDLAATLKRVRNSHAGDLRGRVSVRSRGKPFLAPIEVRSGLALWRDVLTFDGKAEAGSAVLLAAKGRHDLMTGRGHAELALQPFRFLAGQATFRSLIPGLSEIDIGAGSGGGEAHLSWDGSNVDGDMAVRLDGLKITHRSGTTIEGLSANIRLNQLAPPRTPPGQIVRVKRIAAGVAVDDLTFRFALIGGTKAGSTAIEIDTLTVGLAGGRLTMSPTVLGSSATANEATINVVDVDLATLLGLIGIDGVSGTGRLSGSIPLRQSGQALGIDGGQLAAAGSGVMKIRSTAVKKALAQGGADVAMMLDALEDFRYETLTVEIDKAFGGKGRILLRTRGHNPAVRDSQPFVINLDISGNVDHLAAVAARALQLPSDLVRSMLPKAP